MIFIRRVRFTWHFLTLTHPLEKATNQEKHKSKSNEHAFPPRTKSSQTIKMWFCFLWEVRDTQLAVVLYKKNITSSHTHLKQELLHAFLCYSRSCEKMNTKQKDLSRIQWSMQSSQFSYMHGFRVIGGNLRTHMRTMHT